jgi:ABC-2 type transport system ATP-binding protein
VSETLLELRQVYFAYGSVEALRGVTLRLETGTIGVVGNNGAGKSTLLKILLGLIRPSSGDGEVLGCRLWDEGRSHRGMIGYMSEADAVVPLLKGAEFVALSGELYGMPRRDAQRRAHEVLNYVGLGELRYRRLDEYSTGNIQRLKLAAALVHDPQLLLLDEPTNGLDPAGRIAMLRLLEDLIAETGKSVILCTHLLADVERICKQIVVMHGGTVAQAGSIAGLRSAGGGRYRIRWQAGDDDGFVAALRAQGVEVTGAGAAETGPRGAAVTAPNMPATAGQAELLRMAEPLRVAVPPGWNTTRFFEIARACGAAVTHLEPEQEDLERLFFRVTQGKHADGT